MKLKIIIILLNLLLISNFSIAQSDKYPKLEDLFNSGKYQTCIEKAKKYSDKNKKQVLPYLYSAFSYFELYKSSDDEKLKNKYLKKALSNAKKGKAKDKKSVFEEQFKEKYADLQKETTTFANETYSKNKEKSKFFYNYLASVYKDTTDQYKELNGLLNDNSNGTGISLEAKAKIGPNLTDENYLKQGLWRKIYGNGNIAYEATFKDDQPVGVLKRFYENGRISIHLNYATEGSDFASVSMYSKRGQIKAKGFYKGRQKDSTWLYYSSNKNLAEAAAEADQAVSLGNISYLINQINYDNGKKEGIEKKFYPNGKMAQLITWKQDKLEGISQEFFKDGVVKSEFTNKGNKRYGIFKQYFVKGQLEVSGYYVGGHKHGKWIYYKLTGQVEKEIIYIFGVAKNQDELDDEETKLLKEAEKNKGKLEDPEKYRNDPDKFIRGF